MILTQLWNSLCLLYENKPKVTARNLATYQHAVPLRSLAVAKLM